MRRIVGSAERRGALGRPSKRVATTVTQIWSESSSSTLAPKMMLASGWAASPTTLAASETSTRERSAPPVIESRIERAPSIEVSSSGEEIAFSAASIARVSPCAMPIPSNARPASAMIVRTSAKSRLITAGSVTRSEIPCTPWRRTSSATWKASTIEVCWSSTSSRRSLGTTIRVSTSAASSSMPFSAWVPRRLPSKLNGLVTIPTVSAPTSRASRATTGAAPLPVPPPAPAATKTMSEPLSRRLILSCSSKAERWPTSGSAPAPRPRVCSSPMWTVTSATQSCSDCRSVLTAMNSTPGMRASTMRLTALTPAPPTPTTLITGWCGSPLPGGS